ncbi:MAG: hypothetical protein R3F14_25610 [Polyangiaceae bacterium]
MKIIDRGGLVYGDGANTSAIMGHARPGDVGVDVIHINLHKTFTTPHGGGGPGSGPVCFKAPRALPAAPKVTRDESGRFFLDRRSPRVDRPRARVPEQLWHVHRAYVHPRDGRREGLKLASALAVLNARYLWALLKDHYAAPVHEPCMHEVILSDSDIEKLTGVKTLDIAKRLLDYGFHAPTVYFPLVVGALMIEPTETGRRRRSTSSPPP